MSVVNILIALILGAIAYFVAQLFLPYVVAILLAILVIVLVVFGSGRLA
jgi:predicted PurR-regulated permease PerM